MKSWHQVEKEQRLWYWSMGEWVAQALRESGYEVGVRIGGGTADAVREEGERGSHAG